MGIASRTTCQGMLKAQSPSRFRTTHENMLRHRDMCSVGSRNNTAHIKSQSRRVLQSRQWSWDASWFSIVGTGPLLCRASCSQACSPELKAALHVHD